MTTIHQSDFPYEEIRDSNGDYFRSWKEAKETGHDDDQIWSVVEHDDGCGVTYGPPHHWINILGFIATAERHDGETYYEEKWEMEGAA
jgi:hypothetical protein